MSVKAMNWAWDVPGLKPGPRLVLLKLADHANRHHQCWPSVSYLVEKTGLTARQIERILKKLEADGVLEREPWEGSQGTRVRRKDESTYLYTLAVREGCGDPDTMSPRKNDEDDIRAEPTPTFVQADPDIGDGSTPTLAPRAYKEEPTTEPTTEPTAETGPPKAGPGDGAGAPPPCTPQHPRRDFHWYMTTWNEMTLRARVPLAQVRTVSDQNKRHIRKREREPEFDWPAILAKVEQAEGIHRSWLDFGFCVKSQDRYLNVLAGKYDEARDGMRRRAGNGGAGGLARAVTDAGTVAPGQELGE